MALVNQFIAQELQASTQTTPMSADYSFIDCFGTYVYSASSLYNNYASTINAYNDYILAVKSASAGYLSGFISPCHLRMSCHFEGSASGVYSGVGDNPVYNSTNASTGIIHYSTTNNGTPASVLASGAYSATSSLANLGASGAFDGNTGTYWVSGSPCIPNLIGVPSATSTMAGSAASNAFDSNTGTYWQSAVSLGSNILTGGSASGTNIHSGSASNTIDGNIATMAQMIYTSSPMTITIDLGSGNNQTALTWGYYSGVANGSGSPQNMTVYGSLDNSSFTQLWTGSLANGIGYFYYSFANSTAYRYYKFSTAGTDGSGFSDLYELYMYTTSGLSTAQNIEYDSGSGNAFVPANYSVNSSIYTPLSWTLQASNDNSSWSTLDTQSNYGGVFPFMNTVSTGTPYRYYQLNITSTTGVGTVTVSEFRVVGNSNGVGYLSQNPQLLEYDIGSGKALVLTQYAVNASATYSLGYPVTWNFQGSNDNASWTTLHAVSGYAGSFPVTESFTNTTPYRYYGMSISGSKGNSDIVQVSELTAFVTANSYTDTSIVQFGSTSLKLHDVYKAFVSTNGTETELGALNWLFSGFYSFDQVTYANQGLFYITNQLDIMKTQTGIWVGYYTTGWNGYYVPFSWSFNTMYCIQVGVQSGTLSIAINGTVIGSVSLNGASFNYANNTSVYIGYDHNNDYMYGNVDEVQLYIGDNPGYIVPTGAMSSAYVPAITWQSGNVYMASTPFELDVVVFQDIGQFASYGAGVPQWQTDCNLYVSANGGTTFTQVALSKGGNLTNNCVAFRGSLSLTGIPNTNQLCYKIISNSGKVFKLDGVILYWQDVNSTILSTSIPELGSVPIPADSIANKIQAVYQYLMFKRSVNSSTETMYKSDNATILSTAALVDDGATFTKGAQ